ncbi:hypothetical protein APY03_2400 [Variovorax sp. WDL1]|nr:hypothetical protein APY03_2400 [Variovorax sp. WDL1]
MVGLHEDDEYVTIRYRNLKRESGQMVGAGFEYLTSHWLEVFETAAEKGTSVCRPSLLERTVFSNGDLLGLVSRVGHFGVDDSPDYQRGYAWTADDKDRYLDSLFCGRDLGRFIFVNYGYTRPAEVFDGKQRLSTLMELVQSRRAYKGIYWHEMLKRERRHVESRVVQVAEVPASKASRAELLQMFLDVNAAGVPQTEEHLNHVRRLLEAEQRNASAN